MGGGSEYEHGDRTALGLNGEIYITGSTNSYGAGNDDVFILKYASSKGAEILAIPGFSIIPISLLPVICIIGITYYVCRKEKIKFSY